MMYSTILSIGFKIHSGILQYRISSVCRTYTVGVCVVMGRKDVYVPAWLGFCYIGFLEKVEVRLQQTLGQRDNKVLHISQRSCHKVKGQLRSS